MYKPQLKVLNIDMRGKRLWYILAALYD